MAGVAPADALGGAVPLAALLVPGVLGCVPVVADGVEGFGLGLGLKALVRKGSGVGPLALLGAIGLVHEGRLYGLLDRPTAVAALGAAGAVPAIGLLLPSIVLVFEVVLALAIGVAVGQHLAAGPHELAVDIDVGAAGVVTRLATKAKELRAGSVVTLCSDNIVAGNVENVLIRTHIRVVNIQRLFAEQARIRVKRALVHLDDDVVLASAGISVDVDDLAAGVEGAAVERHSRRTVRPEGIVATRSVERGALELGGAIAPVERLSVNDAPIDDGLVGANETKVVCVTGAQRHVLKRYGAGAIEGIIAVVLGAEIGGIGHKRADVPRGLFGSLAHKGEILALGGACGVHLIERIVALTKHKGVSTGRLFGGDGDVCVDGTGLLIGDGPCCAICKCW